MGNDESLPYAQYAQRPAPKILGIGLNYLKEGAQGPPNPIVFLKSWSSINYDPKQLSLSLIEESKLIHELELGVMIKSKAFRVSQEEAMNYVGGYFIGIDITDTSKGKPGDYIPETFVKSQDNFCPVSPLIKQKVDPYQIELEYKSNGVTRQKDFVKTMYFKIDRIIEYITQYISLNEGDLILTGTPLGAGPIKLGDEVQCYARYKNKVVAELSFTVVQ